MAAIVGAIITAAAAAYSAHKSAKATKKVGKQQDRLYGIQADTAEQLQPLVLDYYRKAGSAFDPALSYYRALASGDESKIYGAISPELAGIGRRYRSLFNASSELNQRGGMSASYAAELPFRAADEKSALIKTRREGAYGNLASIAGQLANVGAGAAGGAQSGASGAGSTLNNAWVMAMMNGQNQADAYGKIGDALGDIWKKYKTTGTG